LLYDNFRRTVENEKEKNQETIRELNEQVRAQNKELQQTLNDLENAGKKSTETAGGKANNAHNEGCLQEALARHKHGISFTGQISTEDFLLVCLRTSEPSPAFCDGVPPQNEIMRSASWGLKKCSDAGLQNDQGCRRLFGAVQAYCHKNVYSPEK
jgi:hypothetical protein